MLFDDRQSLRLRHLAAHHGMPLPPHAVRADVNESHIRVAIISGRHGGEELLQLGQEYGIAKIWIPRPALLHAPLAERVEVSLGPGLTHPFGRRKRHPVLRPSDAKRDALRSE